MSMMQPDPAMMGAPPEPAAGDEQMGPADHLRAALEHVQAAQVSEQDDADSQTLAKIAADLYSIMVGRQKETDTMLGNPTIARALRRS